MPIDDACKVHISGQRRRRARPASRLAANAQKMRSRAGIIVAHEERLSHLDGLCIVLPYVLVCSSVVYVFALTLASFH